MAWIYLIVAAAFEIAWTFSLKATAGFTKVIPIIFYVITGIGNVFFFSLAMKEIPMATALAVWMGISVTGVTIIDAYLSHTPPNLLKFVFIALIAVGVVGLKVLNPAPASPPTTPTPDQTLIP